MTTATDTKTIAWKDSSGFKQWEAQDKQRRERWAARESTIGLNRHWTRFWKVGQRVKLSEEAIQQAPNPRAAAEWRGWIVAVHPNSAMDPAGAFDVVQEDDDLWKAPSKRGRSTWADPFGASQLVAADPMTDNVSPDWWPRRPKHLGGLWSID